MAFLRLFQICTKLFLPWQAPSPLPMKGYPQRRQGLYEKLYQHLPKNSRTYLYIFHHAGIGGVYKCIGDSMRPSFTGQNEIVFSSYKVRGGRGLRIGDVVAIRDSEEVIRGKPKENYHILKRIVALPGEKHYKEGRRARYLEMVQGFYIIIKLCL